MNRSATLCIAVCALMLVAPSGLFAQSGSKTTSDPGGSSSDPRTRRANREKAVAAIGTTARDFVEAYGDEAVAAIFACTKSTGVKLAEFHASGELGKLPRPRDLLRVIAAPRHGDDVALWAMQHGSELIDTDSFDAYLANPLEYAMGLKPLQTGAAYIRAKRLDASQPTATTEAGATTGVTTKVISTFDSLTNDDRVGLTACVCAVILIAVCRWRKKREAAY